MKIKLQFVEGFHMTVWKEPVEIETDNYPELEGMSKEEAIDYIRENCDEMANTDGTTDPGSYSLYEELMEQDVDMEKEKNYDWDIEEA
jgi:hypothetical protein